MIYRTWAALIERDRTRARVEANAWRSAGRAKRHPTPRNRILAEVWQVLRDRLPNNEETKP